MKERDGPRTVPLSRFRPASSGRGFAAHDADEADALARGTAKVVGEGQLAAGGNRFDGALGRSLASQLQPALEQHPQSRSTDGVAEGLEATVGVDRELAVEVEGAGEDFLPGRAPLGETQVLHQDELRRGETVVDL